MLSYQAGARKVSRGHVALPVRLAEPNDNGAGASRCRSFDHAPLVIAPGSHEHGRIAVEDVDRVVEPCRTATCIAEAGDVWLYATPILHASEAAVIPTSRRVLQVESRLRPSFWS